MDGDIRSRGAARGNKRDEGLTRRDWVRSGLAKLGAARLALGAAWASTAAAAEEAPPWAPELAEVWDPQRSPKDFAVSEKYDGVRAVWDGQHLRFRSGRLIRGVAPAWLAHLPPLALDGELWLGRRRFDALSGLVRSEAAGEVAWGAVRYMVFDAPQAAGPFVQRLQTLQAMPPGRVWQVVPQVRVANAAQLRARLSALVRQGGEGLVLHRWDAPWAAGRSGAVFKFKPFDDAEAQVVAYRPGQGKYAGQVGALWVQTPDGRRFALGSGLSDLQRREPPPVGAWVTYRHQGLTAHGLPRFAVFVRERLEE